MEAVKNRRQRRKNSGGWSIGTRHRQRAERSLAKTQREKSRGDMQGDRGTVRAPEYSMHRRECGASGGPPHQESLASGALEQETFLCQAQISSRLLCSGLPPGAFSGGAGEVEDRGG